MRVRDAFFQKIYEKTCAGEDIVIVSSDIGAPSLDDFRRDYPQRFVNVGIAEQNAIAVAGGLCLSGKKVITYGLNPFPVTRAFDQVRNILSALNLPIAVTALNAGTCSAEAGYTHIPMENMSIMRTLGNVKLLNFSDESMAIQGAEEVISNPAPRYIQFDKYIDGNNADRTDFDFEKGFFITNPEERKTVVTYGIYAAELRKAHVPYRIIDCFALPVNEKSFVQELEKSSVVVTLDDGTITGGIGSMVLELLNTHQISLPVYRKGITSSPDHLDYNMNRTTIWKREEINLSNVLREVEAL